MSAPEDKENPIGSGVIESDASCRCFSLAEMQSATNNFNDMFVIGVGGFGKVYKGFIIDDDGTTVVAIKRLNSESKQGAKEFSAEIKMLSKLRHANLVALIGYCSDCEEKILVYEYIARGTFADHLYKTSKKDSSASSSPLSWEQRLEICVDAARGLDYIHSGTNQRFIHRDVKTANILLDENWVVKISDFGLSKGTTSHSITHLTTDVKGTFGYLDPDYFLTQRLTTKSDVYAFGVVLLEVLCGRQPVDRTLEEEQISLVSWAQQYIKKRKLNGVIDPSLSGQISSRCLNYFVKVANNCLQKVPKARPTMAEVVESLDLALALQRKVRTEGIFTKTFQGIPLVPKGMDHWLRERKDDGSVSGPTKDLPQKSHPDSVTRFFRHLSFADIRAATNDFDAALLLPGEGNLYKGYVSMDGRQVLVSRQFVMSQEWDKVRAAIQERSLLHHRHILSLIGFCYEGDEVILVYDYTANGSLQGHLNRRNNETTTWKERLEICIGAARGFQYLHAGVEHKTASYNIKPSSILLDKNGITKVGAFKINRKTTPQSDMYLFGVVLWKVLRSETALDELIRVIPAYHGLRPFDLLEKILQIKAIGYVLDPYLFGKTAPESLEEFGKIALSCLSDREETQRPSMDSVVESLQSALRLHEIWLSHTKIDAHDLDSFSRPDIFREIGKSYEDLKLKFFDVDRRVFDLEILPRALAEFMGKGKFGFDLENLPRALAEFMGKGKFGSTYRANLGSGLAVVVKRLKPMNALSKKEFVQQMPLLGNMRHENLVEIISLYSSKDENLVIYEFVPDGNLFELLHENRGVDRVPLNWNERLSIIKEIAKGLAFLHHSLPHHEVLHGNLKSSNVLIHRDNGQNYHAKLTGFGFLPIFPPEKSSKGRSVEADVYSFGMVVLEVITRRMPDEFLSELLYEVRDMGFLGVTNWLREADMGMVLPMEEASRLMTMALEWTQCGQPKMSEVVRMIDEMEQVNRAGAR